MSPILDLQRRLREAGRIRIGDTVASSGKRGRPVKLETFRFTSADRRSIDAVARLYGGIIQRWAGAPVGDQFEVVTEAKSIPVVLPPGPLAMSQWYEEWSGGGCTRRCDGVTETISDSPCVCNPDDRDCKPHTRLSLILRDLEGIGTWRLDTSGWNAATELSGTMDLVGMLQTQGRLVTGRLVLNQRQSKKGGKTMNYAVPGLDLDINVAAMSAAIDAPEIGVGARVLELEERFIPAVTPIPADEEPVPSIAAQMAAVEDDTERPRRANAPAPIKPSGIEPRPLAEADDILPVVDADIVEDDDEEPKATPPQQRNINRLLTKIKVSRADRDGRLTLCSEIIGRTISSSLELTKAEAVRLIEELMERAGESPSSAEERFAPHPGEEPFE